MNKVIGIPQGTRLYNVVLDNDEVHVWIAVKKRDPDYKKWQGTFLRVMRNGSVTRETLDDDLPYDDTFVIVE